MRESAYKNYNKAKVLGTSPSSGYELMHQPDFPVLRVGSRMVVPKEKFIQWVRIQEVLYEVSTVAQTRSQQKLF